MASKIMRAYRFTPEKIAEIESLIPVVRELTKQNSDATAVIEFAVAELIKRYVNPRKTTGRLGPAVCSECGKPAQEGTFLCSDHAQMV